LADPGTAAPFGEQPLQAPPFRRVLCFGDSMTKGVTSRGFFERFTLSPVEGYIPKLKRLLRQEFGDSAQLFNSGTGGETTGQGLERLRVEIRSARYDLVLLLEGVVDVNNPEPQFERARANLKEMIRVVKGEGISVIVATIPPLNEDGFRTRGAENVPRLNDMIREEAELERVPLADHEQAFGRDLTLQGPDGLHPNDAGYEVMAETWFEAIMDLAAELET
jgi:lysophospholipase L1-like esterase